MTRYVKIDDWIQIRISGPQKNEYLNGIITFDLNSIGEGDVVRSAFLTPNSKIRSVYWLEKTNNTYQLYCPGEMKDNLVDDLVKFKLSMDVKLEDITDESDTLYLIETDNTKIDGLSNENIGFYFANLEDTPQGNELSYNEFLDLLVVNGIVPPDIMLDQNPYEIGINDAIALEKGCFLGQEPLSRMFHRGNLRKYVYQFKIDEELSSNEVKLGDDTVGEVLKTSVENNNIYGLAYIRRTVESLDELNIENTPIEVLKRVGNYPKIART